VDGGITANTFVLQFLADLLERPVDMIGMPDVSAMGAAFMAGLGAGVYADTSVFRGMSCVQERIEPKAAPMVMEGYARWRRELFSGSGQHIEIAYK
jgi:glycerol kinase